MNKLCLAMVILTLNGCAPKDSNVVDGKSDKLESGRRRLRELSVALDESEAAIKRYLNSGEAANQ